MATACRAHSRGLLLLGDPKNTLLRDRCSNMRGGPTQNVQLFQCFFLKKLFDFFMKTLLQVCDKVYAHL